MRERNEETFYVVSFACRALLREGGKKTVSIISLERRMMGVFPVFYEHLVLVSVTKISILKP